MIGQVLISHHGMGTQLGHLKCPVIIRKTQKGTLHIGGPLPDGVVDIEDHPNFVVVEVMSRSTVAPQILIDTVRRIAKKGDELEAALTQADNY